MMSSVLKSHKPATVRTFLPYENIDIVKKLESIKFDETDSLSKNYIYDMKWNDFDAVSIYERNNQIIGFSSVWHRSEYYQLNEVRILNRYWESSEMRKISKMIGGAHLIEMVTQQLNICKLLGRTRVFISRENSPRYFKRLVASIADKTQTHWNIEPNKVCVCGESNPSCWQYKAWTDL